MGARVARLSLLALCGVSAVLLWSGCGEAQRDAGESSGVYTVEVAGARFPARQAIAHDTTLEIDVRNAGSKTIPDVAVTLDSLSYQSEYPGLAARERPTWIVNQGPGPIAKPPVPTQTVNQPGGGVTAFVHTWALGALAPGATRAFVWHVTPVKAGTQTVHYTVAAGLDGRAKASLEGGGTPTGHFTVSIAGRPPKTHVNPETGRIAPGPTPVPLSPQPAAP
jgi:hypothetical protein